LAGAGCDAGAAGWDVVCEGFSPDSTDFEVGPLRRMAKIERVIEVTMKRTADHVVAFDRAVAAPRGPNAV